MKFLRKLVFPALLLYFTPVSSQGKFSAKFNDANLLMDEKRFAQAFLLLNELLNDNPENCNLNYKAGLCIFESSGLKKNKALPYFEKAVKNVTGNYDKYSPFETRAPLESYYYLARTYHLAQKIDKALYYFVLFQNNIGRKHYLETETRRQILTCIVARELIANPVKIRMADSKNINTAFSEYGPVISLDKRKLFFTSKKLRSDSSNALFNDESDERNFEDVYVSENVNGQWQQPSLLPFCLPDENEHALAISPDGNILYVSKDNEGFGKDIFKSQLIGGQWSAFAPYTLNINSKFNETGFSVSADNSTIYFASDRKGGLGGMDIYFVKKSGAEWEDPQNMGPAINTSSDEINPFIHPDGKTLYFSSNGNNSMGGFDVFYSTFENNVSWTMPQNVGYPVNSTGDDYYLQVTADGKSAYLSSSSPALGSDGDLNIYALAGNFPTSGEIGLVKGAVRLLENTQIPEGITVEMLDADLVINSVDISEFNKYFAFIGNANSLYQLSFKFKGKEFYKEELRIPEVSFFEMEKDVLLKPVTDAQTNEIISFIAETTQKINEGALTQLPTGELPEFAVQTSAGIIKDPEIMEVEKESVKGISNTEIVEVEKEVVKEVETVKPMEIETEVNVGYINISDTGKVGKINAVKTVENEVESVEIMEVENEVVKEVPVVEIVEMETTKEAPVKETEMVEIENKANMGTIAKPSYDTAFQPLFYYYYFPYNESQINAEEVAFAKFTDDVAEYISKKGMAKICIEATASSVPTTSYNNSNAALAETRAQNVKNYLLKTMQKKGIGADKTEFTINTFIAGPEYKEDAKKNKKSYGKYQYVKIFIKE